MMSRSSLRALRCPSYILSASFIGFRGFAFDTFEVSLADRATEFGERALGLPKVIPTGDSGPLPTVRGDRIEVFSTRDPSSYSS